MRLGTRCAIALALLLPATSSAQQAEVRGRVVEFGTRTGIAGVSVDLNGVGRATTNREGDFRFSTVPVGTNRLSFTVIGFQPRDVELTVRGDTAVVIELEVAALPLDPLMVRARNITVRGSVRDAIKKIDVVDAEVLIGSLKPTTTNVAGHFKVGRVPANNPVQLQVRAIGYQPFRAVITADRDTTLRVDLTIDPLGQKFIAEHLAELEVRGRGLPFSRMQFNQDQLLFRRGQTIEDFLKAQMGPRPIRCLFIDEREQSFVANEIIKTYFVEELHRIEIYDRGTMVRIYTARHFQKNIGSTKNLPPIVLIKSPLICR